MASCSNQLFCAFLIFSFPDTYFQLLIKRKLFTAYNSSSQYLVYLSLHDSIDNLKFYLDRQKGTNMLIVQVNTQTQFTKFYVPFNMLQCMNMKMDLNFTLFTSICLFCFSIRSGKYDIILFSILINLISIFKNYVLFVHNLVLVAILILFLKILFPLL